MSDELLKLLAESPFNSIEEVNDYMTWYEGLDRGTFPITLYDIEKYRICQKINAKWCN